MRQSIIAIGAALCVQVFAAGSAQAYPPPQSPQDQYCRQVAQAGVFSEPNPKGLGLFEHGYQIWGNCMRKLGARVPSSRYAKQTSGRS
jgi:hypothetical protein